MTPAFYFFYYFDRRGGTVAKKKSSVSFFRKLKNSQPVVELKKITFKNMFLLTLAGIVNSIGITIRNPI